MFVGALDCVLGSPTPGCVPTTVAKDCDYFSNFHFTEEFYYAKKKGNAWTAA